MTWEQVIKHTVGARQYGPNWKKVPCVSVNKSGLTFNSHASVAYNIKKGSYVLVMKDVEQRIVGFRLLRNGDDGGFKVQQSSGCETGSVTIVMKAVGKAFPDCTGYAYRAVLSAEDRLVLISLDPKNRA